MLYFLGRHEEARAALEQARTLSPSDATTWAYLGLTATALGRHEEALAAFKRALELDAEHVEAWSGFGELLIALGRHEEAVQSLEHALRLDRDPKEVRTWELLASALRACGQNDDATAAEREVARSASQLGHQ